MTTLRTFVPALVAVAVMFTASAASASAAALVADEPHSSSASQPTHTAPRPAPAPWVVRAEGSLVAMRDNWLGFPGAEVGLTMGRDLARVSVEVTGSVRDPGSSGRSWSAMAMARWAVLSSASGRHRLTLAGGPFVEVNHPVHGTMPFAHVEVAYVYRATDGVTLLVGAGPNFALANSSYVAPPRAGCDSNDNSSSDAIVVAPCLDFGPDAEEIHAGDRLGQMRVALGWLF